MNRIRRPWPAARRDTDSVQLNTLGSSSKADEHGIPQDTKGGDIEHDVQPVDVEHGHLQEIEVDVDKVLHDGEIKDVDEDTSPYPEGTACATFKKQKGGADTDRMFSPRCRARDRRPNYPSQYSTHVVSAGAGPP